MKFEQVKAEQSSGTHRIHAMDSMKSLETEYGVITDPYCDIMDSLVTP